MNFQLMEHHKMSLMELEGMLPFERTIYISLLLKYLDDVQKQTEAGNK